MPNISIVHHSQGNFKRICNSVSIWIFTSRCRGLSQLICNSLLCRTIPRWALRLPGQGFSYRRDWFGRILDFGFWHRNGMLKQTLKCKRNGRSDKAERTRDLNRWSKAGKVRALLGKLIRGSCHTMRLMTRSKAGGKRNPELNWAGWKARCECVCRTADWNRLTTLGCCHGI